MFIDIRQSIQRCEYLNSQVVSKTYGTQSPALLETIKMSSDSLAAIAFQRGYGVTLWDLSTDRVLGELADKTSTCADGDFNLERVAIGLKSGVIRLYEIIYKPKIAKDPAKGLKYDITSQADICFHSSELLGVKISKNG